MRTILLTSLLIVAGIAGAATPARAQVEIPPACREGPADVSIAACTRFLDDKKLPPEARVIGLIRRGDAHMRGKALESAIADYDAAIKLDPKSGLAYNQRGIALRVKGEYERAVDSYNISIALQPQFAVRYFNRGIAYRWKGDLDRALVDLNTAISIKPDGPRMFTERATIYRLKLDFARALADNNQAIKLDRNAFHGYAERALTHEARNDFKASLADFRQALLLAPKNERLQRAIARLEFKVSNPDGQSAATQPGQKALSRSAGQRVALVIGNSRYNNASPLANPRNDAEALAKALRGVGFSHVALKLDQSREQLAVALKEFAAVADKAEWAVIYYAGHGIEVGGNNYLVPVDAKFATDRDVSFEAVTLDQVLQSVEGASKLRLVILDACRDNPFARKMVKGSGTRSIGSGLGNIEPEGATLVAYAAKHGQTADDGQGGNSPFAASLVRNLQTPGLEINLLFRKVRDEVLNATGKRQEPFTYGSLPSEPFYFAAK